MLQPNEAAILLLFGEYVGTDRSEGLRWANPFYKKQKISLRAHNLMSERLKVNDSAATQSRSRPQSSGGCATPHRRCSTSRTTTSTCAYRRKRRIRHLASRYAYDEGEHEGSDEPTLRASQDRVHGGADPRTGRSPRPGRHRRGRRETDPPCLRAGNRAGHGLRRQQAEAIIAARSKIVHGAGQHGGNGAQGPVGARHRAPRRRAPCGDGQQPSVVLCSEGEAQPVINTGTLYQ